MDLKSFLPGENSPPKEDYWSLIIEPEWVQAGIWSVREGKVEVVSVSHPLAWQGDSELLSSVDSVLSSVIQALPEDTVEPSKTVFGVTSSWVSNGEIKPEYLEKIKVICSKLELTPVGFVILQEAVSHFIKSEEGSPLNGIIVFLSTSNIEVSVIKMGNQAGSVVVARSVSIVEDIAEGLSRFTEASPFPSRIIIYDGREGELGDEKQSVINADWESFEKVQFLHTPKIETISPDKKVLAVCLAGGLELAKVDKVAFIGERGKTEEESEVSSVQDFKEAENVIPATAPDLGFYVNKDVAGVSKPPNIPPVSPTSAHLPRPVLAGLIARLKGKLLGLKRPQLGNRLRLGGRFGSKKIIIIGVVGLALFFTAGFIYWWVSPKANITIYVFPQNIEDAVTIMVSTKATSADLSGKVIPGEIVVKKESGEKERKVTGSKIVGDKAKGEIKLFRSGGEIKLSAGTPVTSSGGLVFTLDSEAVVASGSASSPGTKVVPVTAQKIGTDSNLPSGTSFKVENYPTSDIEAKNEGAFTGGTSREISAVSEDDESELEEGLLLELKDKALSEIEASLTDDKYLIRESLKVQTKDRSFSAKVGDEASNLTLDLSVEGKALTISKTDLFALGKEILGPKVSKDYVLRDGKLEADFEYIGEKDEATELKVTLKALLLPTVNIDEIKKNILGKYSVLAGQYLKSIGGVAEVKIVLEPVFPGRLSVIPRFPKNINIEIDAK